MNDETTRLIALARTAAANAHAPYSGFGVGAAVLLSDGSVVHGANFENASYGLSLCAETVALATVNAQGRLADVVAIGVVGGMIRDGAIAGEEVVRPCGRCRQVINEAAQIGGRDIRVHCAGAEGEAVTSYLLSQLLPDAFGPADLGIGAKK
ncbi:cytidine deaminase [Sphingomonas mucosissima]|uniref:Cytidine deaminase n=1 Tax=Sphingomonas mucosissima TaxID=370959 RepID=A0A245ZER7_9SPHN|nr:cytidine deaminase [Sphingomonas mucosissima]OWK28209.1 cytidine deaminase [Sphingomonas mucosissima]